ncbi:MAG: HPF/RaiA family ribosome-associated protein [Anaeromyxobacter sp.]
MKLVIHAHHLALPPDLGTFLQKHVTRPLARLHDDPAASLSVFLSDTRAQRGGVDQECRLAFRIPGARSLTVTSVQADLYQALLDCTDRLKRLVKREVAKMRSGSRKPMHRPLGRSWRERSSRTGTTPEGDPAAL